MKLIIGLGNPGKTYENTRHNAGFIFLDGLREKFLYQNTMFATEWRKEETFQSEIAFIKSGSKIIAILQKPLTFMNNSGIAVEKIIKKFDIPIEDITLVHDDLDIKLGNFKIQIGKAPLCHNGIDSVEKALKTKDFRRIRMGVENRENTNIPGMDYVLKKFSKTERPIFDEAVESAIQGILSDIIL